jgi:hypothetical protein
MEPKKRKEKRINLYCNKKRTIQLNTLCGYLGFDQSRVADNDSELIWQILDRMEGVLKVRNRLKLQALEDLKDLEISEVELLGVARRPK